MGGSAGFVSRWLFISALLGLLIGFFEAWMLWTRPRVIPLLEPDVAYVVWFLAPLIDMAFFALAGLALGWLVSRRIQATCRSLEAARVSLLMGAAMRLGSSAASMPNIDVEFQLCRRNIVRSCEFVPSH